MSETITACENVCRDFAWVTSIISGLVSFAPLIAIASAVLVYYWQRKADREAELRREQREAYREFFINTLAINRRFQEFDLSEQDDPLSAMKELFRARGDYESAFKILALSASPVVLKAAQICKDGLHNHLLKWGNAMKPFLGKKTVQKTEVHKAIRTAGKMLTKSIRKDELELLKVMRREEFSEPIDFETP